VWITSILVTGCGDPASDGGSNNGLLNNGTEFNNFVGNNATNNGTTNNGTTNNGTTNNGTTNNDTTNNGTTNNGTTNNDTTNNGDPCSGVVCGPTEVCEPASGRCVASLPDSNSDEDGDGRTYAQETEGYSIQVDRGTGPPTSEMVTSDPRLADTDGDGLNDREEFENRTDPGERDTDNDGIEDAEEVRHWASQPAVADTDDDGLDDGEEVDLGTSLSIRDTDGDGLWDGDEEDLSRNPLIAELPQVAFDLVGALQVSLDVNYVESEDISYTFSQAYEEVQASGLSRSDAESNTLTASLSTTVTAEATTGIPPSASVTGEVSASLGIEAQLSTETTREQSQESSRSAAAEEATSQAYTAEYTGGTISATINLRNPTPLSFNLTGLRFPVLRTEIVDGVLTTETIATLMPVGGDEVYSIGPNGGHSNIQLGPIEDLNLNEARELLGLLRNPTALTLAPSRYTITRRGEDIIYDQENIGGRTALVVVDYGERRPGGQDVARHRIAAKVERDANGQLIGISLADALEVAGHTVTYAPRSTGGTVITSIDGRATYGDPRIQTDPIGYWVLIGGTRDRNGTLEGHPDVSDPNLDPHTLRLMPQDEIRVVFVSDDDRDLLNSREEFLLGTSDHNIDSDSDGIPDYIEVTLSGSNPALADTDGDGLNDHEEYGFGTNIRRADTDRDGIRDLDELRGWTATGCAAFGGTATSVVMTNPLNPDTDGDGARDGVERAISNSGRCPLPMPIPARGQSAALAGIVGQMVPGFGDGGLRAQRITSTDPVSGECRWEGTAPPSVTSFNSYAVRNTTGAPQRLQITSLQGNSDGNGGLVLSFDGVLTIYRDRFNPASTLDACVTANDDDTVHASAPWTRSTTSYVEVDIAADETLIVMVSAFYQDGTGLHNLAIRTVAP